MKKAKQAKELTNFVYCCDAIKRRMREKITHAYSACKELTRDQP